MSRDGFLLTGSLPLMATEYKQTKIPISTTEEILDPWTSLRSTVTCLSVIKYDLVKRLEEETDSHLSL